MLSVKIYGDSKYYHISGWGLDQLINSFVKLMSGKFSNKMIRILNVSFTFVCSGIEK